MGKFGFPSTLVSGELFRGSWESSPRIGRLVYARMTTRPPGAHPYARAQPMVFLEDAFRAAIRALSAARSHFNGSPFTIIGVTRRGFTGTQVGNSPGRLHPNYDGCSK